MIQIIRMFVIESFKFRICLNVHLTFKLHLEQRTEAGHGRTHINENLVSERTAPAIADREVHLRKMKRLRLDEQGHWEYVTKEELGAEQGAEGDENEAGEEARDGKTGKGN